MKYQNLEQKKRRKFTQQKNHNIEKYNEVNK